MNVSFLLTILRNLRRVHSLKKAIKHGRYHTIAGHVVECVGIVWDMASNTPYGKIVCCCGVGLSLVGALLEKEMTK